MNSDVKQALARKWKGEEVAGCVVAMIDGKKVVLGRTDTSGVFQLTDAGHYHEMRTSDVTVSVEEADSEVVEQHVELTDAVEVQAKPKRGVGRPKVEQLEI